MTDNKTKINDHIVHNDRWGGYIYNYDFETEYRGKNESNGSPIAQRIVSSMKFDEMCRKNSIHRDKLKERMGDTNDN